MGKTFNKGVGMSNETYQSYIDRGYTENKPSTPSPPSQSYGNQSQSRQPSFNTGGGSYTPSNTYGSNKSNTAINAGSGYKAQPKVTAPKPALMTGGGSVKAISAGAIPKDKKQKEDTYTWQKGNLFSNVAKSYGLTQAQLRELNGMALGSTIKAGDTLKVPTSKSAGGNTNATTSATTSANPASPKYQKFKSETLDAKAKQPGSGVTGGQLQGVTVDGKKRYVNGDPLAIAALKEDYNYRTGGNIPVNGEIDDDYFTAIKYLNSNGSVSQKTGMGNAQIYPNEKLFGGDKEQYIADNPNSAAAKHFAQLTALNVLTPNGITVDRNDTVDSICQKWAATGGGPRYTVAFGNVTLREFQEKAKASGVDVQNGVLGSLNSPTNPMPGSPLWYEMKELGYSFSGGTGADYNRLKFSNGQSTDNGIYGHQYPSYGAERVDGQWVGDPALAVANFALPRSSGQMDENGLPISHGANPAADIAQERISGMPGFGWEDVQNTIDERLGAKGVKGAQGAQIEVGTAATGGMGPGMPGFADMQMGAGQYGGGGGGGDYGFNDVSYTGIGENDAKSAAQGQVYPQLKSAIEQLEQSTQQAIGSVRRDYEGRGLGQSDSMLNRISQLTADMNEQKATMTQQAEYNISVLAQQMLAESQSQKLQADMFNSQGGYNAYNDWRNAQMQGNRDTFEQWLAKQNLSMDKDGLQFEKDKFNQSQSQFDKELQYKYDTFAKSHSLDELKYLLDEQMTKLEMEIKSGQWELTKKKMLSAAAKGGASASSIRDASNLGVVETREALSITKQLIKNANGDMMRAKRTALSNKDVYDGRYGAGFAKLLVGAFDTLATEALISEAGG